MEGDDKNVCALDLSSLRSKTVLGVLVIDRTVKLDTSRGPDAQLVHVLKTESSSLPLVSPSLLKLTLMRYLFKKVLLKRCVHRISPFECLNGLYPSIPRKKWNFSNTLKKVYLTFLNFLCQLPHEEIK